MPKKSHALYVSNSESTLFLVFDRWSLVIFDSCSSLSSASSSLFTFLTCCICILIPLASDQSLPSTLWLLCTGPSSQALVGTQFSREENFFMLVIMYSLSMYIKHSHKTYSKPYKLPSIAPHLAKVKNQASCQKSFSVKLHTLLKCAGLLRRR